MKKIICLILVLTFCACFAMPAFAAEGDYMPSPGTQPGECNHASTTLVGKKDATCTTEGYTGDQVCDNCSEVVTKGETVPALGHNFVDGVCSNCGAEEEVPGGFSFWRIILIVVLAGGAVGGYFFFRRKRA